MHALVESAVQGEFNPPRLANVASSLLPYTTLFRSSAVLIVRTELTAEASFAAIRDRRRFGMAMAAMIKMIATTIRSSMRENPFCVLFIETLPEPMFSFHIRQTESSSYF